MSRVRTGYLRAVGCAVLFSLAGIAANPACAAERPPDGSTPEEKAAIAKDPAFRRQNLVLAGLPRSRAVARPLFNGHDLEGWDSWLGYTDPATTYGIPSSAPIGLNHDTSGVFKVVTEDGQPAIYASGRIFGGLITKKIVQ